MPSGRTIWFATTNRHKFREAEGLLTGLNVKVRQLFHPKIEIQSSFLEKISSFAANNISQIHHGIVVVEDSGLFVVDLGGFPGPFSAYAHQTIGCIGILRLLRNSKRRGAYFQSSVAASELGRRRRVFTGEVKGRIALKQRGGHGFGFDSIFIPDQATMTFGEMDEDQKNRYSHRAVAFRKLATWYLSS